MNKVTRFHPIVAFTLILIAITVSACNQPYSQRPGVTSTPIDPNSMFSTPIAEPPFPGMATANPGPPSLDEQLAMIDFALQRTMLANTVYNPPPEMKLNETKKFQLLLHPRLSEQELTQQLDEPGPAPVSGRVAVAAEMKAELRLPDEAAFSVQSLHGSDVQLISGGETTEWSWYVTAKKPGQHLFTVVLYRLILYEDKAYWRKAAEYPTNINVKATLLDRLKTVHWAWFAGLILAVVTIPALWLLSYQRARQLAQAETSRQRRTAGSPGLASKSGWSGLPGISKRDTSRSQNLGQIFISYRRSDSADITGRIYDRLVDEYGRHPIFKDVDSIPLGTDFKKYLDTKVSECNVLLAVIGNRWADATDAAGNKRLDDRADFVRVEIESALKRDIPVIPLLVGGAGMPAEQDLPSSLRKLVYKNGIPVRPDPDFHRDMDRLIAALAKYIGREA